MDKSNLICPRMAALRQTFPMGTTKGAVLWKAMNKIIANTANSHGNVSEAADGVFERIENPQMFDFETKREKERMVACINRMWRYVDAVQAKVVSTDFDVDVQLLGENKKTSVTMLVDFGDCYQSVRCKYKKPDMSYQARVASNLPQSSIELLRLQKAGEKKVAELNLKKKPVLGTFYFLRAKKDTSWEFSEDFEKKRGDNVISILFSPDMITELLTLYAGKQANAAKEACNPQDCKNCRYKNLCYDEFVPKQIMEASDVPLTPITNVSLTENQRAFVGFRKGQCRVNAVAGSGKTTVVVLRTLELIEEGCNPKDILMITFTDKAKGEMQERLERYSKGYFATEKIPTDEVNVNTFNGLGQEILDKYYPILGFSAAPTVIDDITKKDIVSSLLNEYQNLPMDYMNPFMNNVNAKGCVMETIAILDTMKANHVEKPSDVGACLPSKFGPMAQECLELYNKFNQILVNKNLIDFEDQLRLLLKLKESGVFKSFTWRHVICDEFQDSNPNQIGLLMEMVKECPHVESLAVVGDAMQAIYAFRNATPENMVNFSKYFPDMKDFDLGENFRSETPIIDFANKIIRQYGQMQKFIKAHQKNSGMKPVLRPVDSEKTEISLFVRQAKKLIKNGESPSSIAILARTKSELLKYQAACAEEGVPCVLKVPEIIQDNVYVKSVIALALFLLNENYEDFAYYKKSLHADPFELEKTMAEGKKYFDIFHELPEEKEKINFFLGLLSLAEEDFVAKSFIENMKERGFKTAKQFLEYCKKFKEYDVRDSISTAKEKTDCVTLITVHSSKGLEWDTVLLSIKKFSETEEEQRLFYVAVTRAKKRLLITYRPEQEAGYGFISSLI